MSKVFITRKIPEAGAKLLKEKGCEVDISAKDGVSTEDRIRILRLIKDITGNHWEVDTIHGEGSMAAQEMFLYTSADWKKLQAAAKRAARIDGWQDHPIYGKLPLRTDFVKMPAIDESYESITLTAKK